VPFHRTVRSGVRAAPIVLGGGVYDCWDSERPWAHLKATAVKCGESGRRVGLARTTDFPSPVRLRGLSGGDHRWLSRAKPGLIFRDPGPFDYGCSPRRGDIGILPINVFVFPPGCVFPLCARPLAATMRTCVMLTAFSCPDCEFHRQIAKHSPAGRRVQDDLSVFFPDPGNNSCFFPPRKPNQLQAR